MNRIVLDANQYISALIKPDGLQAKLFQLAYQGKFIILLSPAILEEILRALTYPRIQKYLTLKNNQIEDFLKNLTYVSEMTEGRLAMNVVTEDPDDNKYLACAIEGQAKFIISGDQHLLKIGKYQNIKILHARDFLKHLKIF